MSRTTCLCLLWIAICSGCSHDIQVGDVIKNPWGVDLYYRESDIDAEGPRSDYAKKVSEGHIIVTESPVEMECLEIKKGRLKVRLKNTSSSGDVGWVRSEALQTGNHR